MPLTIVDQGASCSSHCAAALVASVTASAPAISPLAAWHTHTHIRAHLLTQPQLSYLYLYILQVWPIKAPIKQISPHRRTLNQLLHVFFFHFYFPVQQADKLTSVNFWAHINLPHQIISYCMFNCDVKMFLCFLTSKTKVTLRTSCVYWCNTYITTKKLFSTRCNINISSLCYDVSVRLSCLSICLWWKCIGAL